MSVQPLSSHVFMAMGPCTREQIVRNNGGGPRGVLERTTGHFLHIYDVFRNVVGEEYACVPALSDILGNRRRKKIEGEMRRPFPFERGCQPGDSKFARMSAADASKHNEWRH